MGHDLLTVVGKASLLVPVMTGAGRVLPDYNDGGGNHDDCDGPRNIGHDTDRSNNLRDDNDEM